MLNNIAALLDSGVVAAATDYESISTVTVGAGGASTITFSSIPSTYSHLQVRSISKSTTASSGSSAMLFTLNGNAITRYHYLYADGSSVLAGSSTGSSTNNTANANLTSVFSGMVFDLLDYSNVNKNKTVRALGGYDANGSGEIALFSNLYSTNTSAISSIQFSLSSGNFAQYSSFALYGIK